MQASSLDCHMRGIKIKQTSFQSRSTTLGEEEGEKSAENKVAWIHYLAVHNFKMEVSFNLVTHVAAA